MCWRQLWSMLLMPWSLWSLNSWQMDYLMVWQPLFIPGLLLVRRIFRQTHNQVMTRMVWNLTFAASALASKARRIIYMYTFFISELTQANLSLRLHSAPIYERKGSWKAKTTRCPNLLQKKLFEPSTRTTMVVPPWATSLLIGATHWRNRLGTQRW